MSYKNFIPEYWSEKIETELEREYRFVQDCNREFEGKASELGDVVHCIGIARPSIKTISRKDALKDIGEAEEIETTDSAVTLDRMSVMHYMIGDIDKAQSLNKGIMMNSLSKETTEGLANEEDKYVAEFAAHESVIKTSKEPILVTTDNVLDLIDDAVTRLYENDVSDSTDIVLNVSPKFHQIFRKAYREADTNNSDIMKHGRVSMYGNVQIKMSNNVYRDKTTGAELLPMRTKRAFAFVHAMTHTEAYRPQRSFADAIKGFILYGGKVVRPKEAISLNVRFK